MLYKVFSTLGKVSIVVVLAFVLGWLLCIAEGLLLVALLFILIDIILVGVGKCLKRPTK
jgi:hypothetical protein